MLDLIFLAGGKSSRMGLSTPKPFLKLFDKQVFQYSFEVLLAHPQIDQIVVVVASEFRKNFDIYNREILFADPGESRVQSVNNGYQLIANTASSHVIIHDAARPFLHPSDLHILIQKGLNTEGIGLAEKITSTIKHVSGSTIKKNLNRDDYVLMQTPQIIKKIFLQEAEKFIQNASSEITDDLSLLELLDKEGEILFGSPYNFKLTYKQDLEYAEFLLKSGILVIE